MVILKQPQAFGNSLGKSRLTRPRHRKDLLLAKEYAILREQVVETLNRNLQTRLDEA